ncbi:MAG: macro domain-containing protein [Deltaproteobacteria bacterium]|nr:macro domain-containing protein [Deltaproteobacteria bacterium]
MPTYLCGDATRPEGRGPAIIAHVCNDIGAWGKGFVLAVSRRWPEPEEVFRLKRKYKLKLGKVQLVRVEDELWVANMVAQHGTRRSREGRAPIRYEALRTCLLKVEAMADALDASIHMPRIGCGLAGGKWARVEDVLDEIVEADVYVYDLPSRTPGGLE